MSVEIPNYENIPADPVAWALDTEGEPIRGLHAAGEMVGGIFHFNYPGGTGRMAGAVCGKIAGTSAARRALGANR